MPNYEKKLGTDIFFEGINKLLVEGKSVRIRLKGSSMFPFIRHNDSVLLVSSHSVKYGKGSIVVANTNEMGYVIHRIVDSKNGIITLLGDGNTHQFEHTDSSRVIAVVTRYYRGRHSFAVDCFPMLLVGRIWSWMHPWRKKILDFILQLK